MAKRHLLPDSELYDPRRSIGSRDRAKSGSSDVVPSRFPPTPTTQVMRPETSSRMARSLAHVTAAASQCRSAKVSDDRPRGERRGRRRDRVCMNTAMRRRSGRRMPGAAAVPPSLIHVADISPVGSSQQRPEVPALTLDEALFARRLSPGARRSQRSATMRMRDSLSSSSAGGSPVARQQRSCFDVRDPPVGVAWPATA
jgi:hypothetical protein